ncbi:ankyrin repeat-containing domain protein [Podospora aff. communis PSN243]|uniref:Ankyrin repeat-containing domain protein n=1 Tax=Podospora aff. communis PSN243 TaxID=3040156 RepID=A0AAV9GHI8_9PEZI|nr:ankyrin repeat-containing domain protein [Podospora aff. communis PSN243]
MSMGGNKFTSEFGLRVVATPKSGPVDADVVIIHGIWEDINPSWVPSKRAIRGLEEIVSASSPRSRLFEFRYDSESVRSSKNPVALLDAASIQLLQELDEARSRPLTDRQIPISFWSHDIGGMLVKNALVIASRRTEHYGIYLSTTSLVFFGYPHRSKYARDLVEPLLRLLPPDMGCADSLDRANLLADAIYEVNAAFDETGILLTARVLSVISDPSQVGIEPSCLQHAIFDHDMAQLGNLNEAVFTLSAPHDQVAKFDEHAEGVFALMKSGSALPDPTPGDDDPPSPALLDRPWFARYSSFGHFHRPKILTNNNFPPQLRSFVQAQAQEWAHSNDRVLCLSCQHVGQPSLVADYLLSWSRSHQQNKDSDWPSNIFCEFEFDASDHRINTATACVRSFIGQTWIHETGSEEEFGKDVDARMLFATSNPEDLWSLLRHQMLGWDPSRRIVFVIANLDQCVEGVAWLINHIRLFLSRSESPVRFIFTFCNDEKPAGLPAEWRMCEIHKQDTIATVPDSLKQEQSRCDAILNNIGPPLRKWSRSILDMVAFGAQPLHSWELADALGCSQQHLISEVPCHFKGMLAFDQTKLRTAENLTGSQLREVLANTEKGSNWYTTTPSEAHARLARMCCEYLMSHPPHLASLPDVGEALLTICMSPGEPSFLSYAAQYWHFHAKRALEGPQSPNESRDIIDMCVELVCDPSRFKLLAQRLWLDSDPLYRLPFVPLGPLAMVAGLGLTPVVKRLLDSDRMDRLDIAYNNTLGDALATAAASGQQDVLQLLLGSNWTPSAPVPAEAISFAAHWGHVEILQSLVSKASSVPGVRVEMDVLRRAGFFGLVDVARHLLDTNMAVKDTDAEPVASPLYVAVQGDQTEVVSLLISRNAPINGPEPFGCTPLGIACSHRCVGDAIIDLLLANGASAEVKDEENHTPLSEACVFGRHSAVERLLKHGACPILPPESKMPLLALATHYGSKKCLEHLLADKRALPDLNSSGPPGTALACAASNLGLEMAEALLKLGADPNLARDDSHIPPLGMAAAWNNFAMAETLLEPGVGADIEAEKRSNGDTALLISLFTSHITFAKLLINHGANVNHANKDGFSPLMVATETGNTEIVALLLEKGANINHVATGASPHSAIHLAAANSKSQAVFRLLVENGADVHLVGPMMRTPLMTAASQGRPDAVQCLIDRGANLETVAESDGITETALLLAVRREHRNVARALLEAGADINHVPPGCFSPLQTALIHDDEEMLSLLLEYQPDMNTQDATLENPQPLATPETKPLTTPENNNTSSKNSKNTTPPKKLKPKPHPRDQEDFSAVALLSMIAETTPLSMVRKLVNRGARVNPLNPTTVHPLVRASYVDNPAIIAYLLSRGADVHACRSKDGCAIHVASQFSCVEIIKTLVDSGADVNSVGSEYWHGTPVQRACMGIASRAPPGESTFCEATRVEVIEFLLDRGADVNLAVHGRCGTALNLACWRCSDAVVELLVARGARFLVEEDDDGDDGSGTGQPKGKQLVADDHGRTAAHFACLHSWERLEFVSRHVAGAGKGADDAVSASRDRMGLSILHWAVIGAKVDVVREIVNRELVDVNALDVDGWTPLMWAARGAMRAFLLRPHCQHMTDDEFAEAAGVDAKETAGAIVEIMQALFAAGADVDQKGMCFGEEWTARDVALYYKLDGRAFELLGGEAEVTGGDGVQPVRIESEQGEEDKGVESTGPNIAVDTDWRGCDACFLDVYGVYYHCDSCLDYDLCFKCYAHRDLIHPKHAFSLSGAAPGPSEEDSSEEDGVVLQEDDN